jgi:hypothetical protein
MKLRIMLFVAMTSTIFLTSNADANEDLNCLSKVKKLHYFTDAEGKADYRKDKYIPKKLRRQIKKAKSKYPDLCPKSVKEYAVIALGGSSTATKTEKVKPTSSANGFASDEKVIYKTTYRGSGPMRNSKNHLFISDKCNLRAFSKRSKDEDAVEAVNLKDVLFKHEKYSIFLKCKGEYCATWNKTKNDKIIGSVSKKEYIGLKFWDRKNESESRKKVKEITEIFKRHCKVDLMSPYFSSVENVLYKAAYLEGSSGVVHVIVSNNGDHCDIKKFYRNAREGDNRKPGFVKTVNSKDVNIEVDRDRSIIMKCKTGKCAKWEYTQNNKLVGKSRENRDKMIISSKISSDSDAYLYKSETDKIIPEMTETLKRHCM